MEPYLFFLLHNCRRFIVWLCRWLPSCRPIRLCAWPSLIACCQWGAQRLPCSMKFWWPQTTFFAVPRRYSLSQLLHSVIPGDWFTSINHSLWHSNSNRLYDIAIHPVHRKFLRFAFEGTTYEYLFLPFEWSLAPWTFTKCLKATPVPLSPQSIWSLATRT